MKHVRLAAIAVLVSAGAAFAQDAAVDINGDGHYSLAEVRAVAPDISADTFAVLDTSGDGLLDAGEIAGGVAAGLLPG